MLHKTATLLLIPEKCVGLLSIWNDRQEKTNAVFLARQAGSRLQYQQELSPTWIPSSRGFTFGESEREKSSINISLHCSAASDTGNPGFLRAMPLKSLFLYYNLPFRLADLCLPEATCSISREIGLTLYIYIQNTEFVILKS